MSIRENIRLIARTPLPSVDFRYYRNLASSNADNEAFCIVQLTSPVFNNQKVNSSPRVFFLLFCFYLYLVCLRAFVIDVPRHLSNDLRKRLMWDA